VIKPKGTGIMTEKFKMTIYDRWGMVVFETTDFNKGWDGSSGNSIAPAGVYIYVIDFLDLKDQFHQNIRGHITLVK